MALGSRYGAPLERREDGSLYQMTEAQQKLAVRLIEKNCCNYWHGSCLLLEDGELRSCPQKISYSVCCQWFRNAVLPDARELALRFTKGKHAFIVATHTDKAHIHNHIIFNSTTIDGSKNHGYRQSKN